VSDHDNGGMSPTDRLPALLAFDLAVLNLALGSSKTSSAVSKPIRCFRRFARFFFSSQAKRVAM